MIPTSTGIFLLNVSILLPEPYRLAFESWSSSELFSHLTDTRIIIVLNYLKCVDPFIWDFCNLGDVIASC